jgi:hypothetical protein
MHTHTHAHGFAEGDGTKVYASCLAFYEEPPAELRARHEQLCGARALKALCLLSRAPYLACSERVGPASGRGRRHRWTAHASGVFVPASEGRFGRS